MKDNYPSKYYSVGRDSRRYFLSFWKKTKVVPEKKSLSPAEVSKRIKSIGVFKKVIINLLDYADNLIGEVNVLIISISKESFSGKVLNIERSIMESSGPITDIYLRGGGGIIEFYYKNGDIASIEEDIDNEIMASMSNQGIFEILGAIDIGEKIVISFFDKITGGVLSGTGTVWKKNLDNREFSIRLDCVNEIEQKKPFLRNLNLESDKIIALDVV